MDRDRRQALPAALKREDALWLALQESGFGGFARNSVVLYPAANVLHVLGVISFFGLVATMDLAVLGLGGRPARR